MKKHGRFYAMEAAGIAGFVILAGSLTVFFEHPAMPVMQSGLWHYPLLRRALLGILMGLYVAWVIKLFGKLSGAHVNPAVTWTFYRTGNIKFKDAVLYTITQFIGAIAGFYLLKLFIGDSFGYPLINYGVSEPKPPYSMIDAFVAEFIISFIMILAVLFLSASQKMEKYTAPASGLLIALFITFELPFSGMSLNPARSFAASFGASEWTHLWLYFVSPVAAMLLAAELFIRWRKKQILHVSDTATKQVTDYKEIPIYPVTM